MERQRKEHLGAIPDTMAYLFLTKPAVVSFHPSGKWRHSLYLTRGSFIH